MLCEGLNYFKNFSRACGLVGIHDSRSIIGSARFLLLWYLFLFPWRHCLNEAHYSLSISTKKLSLHHQENLLVGNREKCLKSRKANKLQALINKKSDNGHFSTIQTNFLSTTFSFFFFLLCILPLTSPTQFRGNTFLILSHEKSLVFILIAMVFPSRIFPFPCKLY